MILSRSSILDAIKAGDFEITPFDEKHVGPNSIDLHLSDEPLKLYGASPLRSTFHELDAGDSAPLDPHNLPPLVPYFPHEDPKGPYYLLMPGRLYLASTREHTRSRCFVPYVDGRSSTGRLGLAVHVTAGRGDVGFRGNWTLELFVVQPLIVRPGMRLAQLTLHTVAGDLTPYDGRYQDSVDAVGSRYAEGGNNK